MEKQIQEIQEGVYIIGFHGPFIMSVLTITQLLNKGGTAYLLVYLFGYFVNKQLNETLKLLFKSPRPEPMDMLKQQQHDLFGWFHRWMSGSSVGDNKIYIPRAHIYGMPSGHAQSAGYSLAFFYMVFFKIIQESRKIKVVLLFWIVMVAINCIVLWQRWAYKAHTVAQLAMGNLIGIVFACILVSFVKKQFQLSLYAYTRKPHDLMKDFA